MTWQVGSLSHDELRYIQIYHIYFGIVTKQDIGCGNLSLWFKANVIILHFIKERFLLIKPMIRVTLVFKRRFLLKVCDRQNTLGFHHQTQDFYIRRKPICFSAPISGQLELMYGRYEWHSSELLTFCAYKIK